MLLPLLALSFIPSVFSLLSEHQQLVSLAQSGNGVIKLNTSTWHQLTSQKRTWSAVIEYTALDPSLKCTPCKEFHPVFSTVAKSWSSVSKDDRDMHFFGSLDFRDGRDVYMQLGLNSAPLVSLYPPAEGPRAAAKPDAYSYDFNNFGSDAKELASQVSALTPVPVPYSPPFNWGMVGTVLSAFMILSLLARISLPILLNRWTWAVVTIGTILVMTSGFMFVRIRGMPYQTKDATMLAGYQNQLGAEIWHMSFIYGSLAFSFLSLILLVPSQSVKAAQRVGIYLFTGVNILLFSMLLADFRIKNAGYPFRLFL